MSHWGHPRHGLRLGPSLAAIGPFDIRWREFERTNNRSADDKSVAGALHGAAAAIVVTGMASHALTRMVKSFTAQRGIPFRCVEKGTETQIAEALIDLFPAIESAVLPEVLLRPHGIYLGRGRWDSASPAR